MARHHNLRVRRNRGLVPAMAALMLTSCASHAGGTGPQAQRRVTLDERNHFFYPGSPPTSGLTAQTAYNALLRKQHHPSQPIPENVTARYGLLTQNNTRPISDRLPVWAFTVKISCMVSSAGGSPATPPPPQRCVFWTFVRASDGKYLDVQDQQVIS
jgi:hypothetical protein